MEFAEDLRQLAINCEFGAFLDEALGDRLVCGIRSEPQQKRLLSEKNLTFEQALEIAIGMEAADRSAKDLKGTSSMATASAVCKVSGGAAPAVFR